MKKLRFKASQFFQKGELDKIMQLPLEVSLIFKNNREYPIIIVEQQDSGMYTIMFKNPSIDIDGVELCKLNMKGTIDIEYLAYKGDACISVILGQPTKFTLHIMRVEKYNLRKSTRVPYRREVKLIKPQKISAIMLNLSTTGTLLVTPNAIDSHTLTFEFVLLNKLLVLQANIIQQSYSEKEKGYLLRCEFINPKKSNQKVLKKAIYQIKKKRKEELANLPDVKN